MEAQTKVCTKCGISKSINDYYTNKRALDEKRTYCKLCFKEMCKSSKNKNPNIVKKYNANHMYKYKTDIEYNNHIREMNKKRYFKKRLSLIEADLLIPKQRKNKCCDVLKEHHEKFKDDPEHLPTDFIKKILGCSCEVKIE